jgi:hypothetical protein
MHIDFINDLIQIRIFIQNVQNSFQQKMHPLLNI